MTEKNSQILDAAQSVFARYGVSKTTMNDIAREAGIARQTLYNKYPGKSEVLRACVRQYADTSLRQVQEAWKSQPTFAGQLDQFFALCPLAWFDTIKSAPEVADLLDGVNAVAAEELNEMRIKWEELWSQQIRSATSYSGDIPALAAFIYSTAVNAKYNLSNREELASRLSVLRRAVLALVA
ncbi:TetR/AcrR family transcriptional regulator [Loktanella sp. Alg231-35]|uniref:TetR/AcrR family transcriptional regulator n=1 Tax=Loktanella sp. Alg231-35 TaxID=1922220 RepID=UPI000D55E121|nr:TetR/AcrR family transcriptional regulator [Loktanella sp. Alg231-35]